MEFKLRLIENQMPAEYQEHFPNTYSIKLRVPSDLEVEPEFQKDDCINFQTTDGFRQNLNVPLAKLRHMIDCALPCEFATKGEAEALAAKLKDMIGEMLETDWVSVPEYGPTMAEFMEDRQSGAGAFEITWTTASA